MLAFVAVAGVVLGAGRPTGKRAVKVDASAALAALDGLKVDWRQASWAALRRRVAGAAAWAHAHPVEAGQPLQLDRAGDGFRVHLLDGHEAQEHLHGSEPVLYRDLPAAALLRVWRVEFFNYLGGGFVALVDADTARVLLVTALVEG